MNLLELFSAELFTSDKVSDESSWLVADAESYAYSCADRIAAMLANPTKENIDRAISYVTDKVIEQGGITCSLIMESPQDAVELSRIQLAFVRGYNGLIMEANRLDPRSDGIFQPLEK